MKRGPQAGGASAVDFVAKAVAAWGEPPAWVLALAEEASRTSAKAAAERLGYTGSVVSDVLGNKYRGDMERLRETCQGAFLGSVVECPVLGEIGRDRCLDEQKQPFRATSAMRAQLYHACRGGCRHARTGGAS